MKYAFILAIALAAACGKEETPATPGGTKIEKPPLTVPDQPAVEKLSRGTNDWQDIEITVAGETLTVSFNGSEVRAPGTSSGSLAMSVCRPKSAPSRFSRSKSRPYPIDPRSSVNHEEHKVFLLVCFRFFVSFVVKTAGAARRRRSQSPRTESRHQWRPAG